MIIRNILVPKKTDIYCKNFFLYVWLRYIWTGSQWFMLPILGLPHSLRNFICAEENWFLFWEFCPFCSCTHVKQSTQVNRWACLNWSAHVSQHAHIQPTSLSLIIIQVFMLTDVLLIWVTVFIKKRSQHKLTTKTPASTDVLTDIFVLLFSFHATNGNFHWTLTDTQTLSHTNTYTHTRTHTRAQRMPYDCRANRHNSRTDLIFFFLEEPWFKKRGQV